MRTILVTGGSGFIGANLIRFLLQEKGCTVVNLDKLSYAGNLKSLADFAGHPNYHFEQIDLAVPSKTVANASSGATKSLTTIFDQYQPDAVMHLAAESHVDRTIDAPHDCIQANVIGSFNLLQASLQYWRSLAADEHIEPVASPGIANLRICTAPASGTPAKPGSPSVRTSPPSQQSFRFLHVSTDEVYGSLAMDAPSFTEASAYDPHSPYAASKAASDHLVRAWGDTYGLPVLVTNCSNNYGPYQFPEKLIPVVILNGLRGESIPVYGNGQNIRDWIYVSDHVAALYAVLTRGRIGETYNIGGNNQQTNIELVRRICKLLDEIRPLPAPILHESLINFVKDRPGHDLRYAIDASKLQNELGWKPQQDFESGLRQTVHWYLVQQA